MPDASLPSTIAPFRLVSGSVPRKSVGMSMPLIDDGKAAGRVR